MPINQFLISRFQFLTWTYIINSELLYVYARNSSVSDTCTSQSRLNSKAAFHPGALARGCARARMVRLQWSMNAPPNLEIYCPRSLADTSDVHRWCNKPSDARETPPQCRTVGPYICRTYTAASRAASDRRNVQSSSVVATAAAAAARHRLWQAVANHHRIFGRKQKLICVAWFAVAVNDSSIENSFCSSFSVSMRYFEQLLESPDPQLL